ncbi:bifunctional hydroxymethylpyrimidine kinase/phosphomethylpyrimidine kinase [Heliobacterium chlorum]|uniref:pyridoxal kinase n=1 Tax=Heliobacterium chlorum TaxID=2698 RepID=A0ABR7T023_HELCL|nr:bifunctional hydroxymethylpyrimidine kinase/phosphomethylpyrimidine kinase [Heliobacterium chlorum]MBC9783338.1 bifunctional hydroxymethylpyrimidine kinase/phosphomethylpyrimidine kinase [Heliobacterium chlorum]
MERIPSVLSVQSMVARGFVGNSAVVPGLLACGIQPFPIHTVMLGAHGAVRPRRGGTVPDALFYGLLKSLEDTPVDHVLSGYLGSARQGKILSRWLMERPDIPYLLDPVLGDDPHGAYVVPEVARVVREDLLPLASVITPNPFEVFLLAGIDGDKPPVGVARGRDSRKILEAARHLLDSVRKESLQKGRAGLKAIVVTGWRRENDRIYTLILEQEKAWEIGTALVPWAAYGTGDLFAAILVAGICHGYDVSRSCMGASRAVAAALEQSQRYELDTVAPIHLPKDLFEEEKTETETFTPII